jgi:hypothetical protein
VSTETRLAWTLALLAGAAAAVAQEPVTENVQPSIIVELADGSTLPMREWTLAYEYLKWPAKGGSPATGDVGVKEASAILLGKKNVPVTGATVDIAYRDETRAVDEDTTAVVGVAREVTITPAGGKPVKIKVESPDRAVLVPEITKETNVLARSLDLRGFTLTGTRRDFCLVSFSTLVQCGTRPADRVVRIRFNP